MFQHFFFFVMYFVLTQNVFFVERLHECIS